MPRFATENQLRWEKYSPAYRARLIEGAEALRTHLDDRGWEWNDLKSAKAQRVDQMLLSFVSALHANEDKSSLRKAKHGVLFVQAWRPRLRKALQGTWQTLRAWEEQRPSRFRPPMPLPLLAAFVCAARERAYFDCDASQRETWLVFSAMLLLGFFGLLRPGELLNLAVHDITLPNTMSLGSPFAVVRIRKPKNARQMGQQQFAEVRHPDAINWLVWLVEKREAASSLLWKGNHTKFRIMFRHMTQRLGLESLRLSPASLRAGGATWMLDERIEVSRIRFSGRWANLRSLEHYLQVARAQQIAISLPAETAEHLKHFLCKFCFMLCLPQFLVAQVRAELLVPSQALQLCNAAEVSEGLRAWGRTAETVQESYRFRRTLTRCEVSRHRMGRFEKSSSSVQDRS